MAGTPGRNAQAGVSSGGLRRGIRRKRIRASGAEPFEHAGIVTVWRVDGDGPDFLLAAVMRLGIRSGRTE